MAEQVERRTRKALFHLRRAWPCKDEETGLTTTDQTKALLKSGILPPEAEKKISKKNNPKMTFDKMCREKWIFIACSHGLEIEYTPKPRDEQLDSIVDLFAAAFANSNKAIKDGYDSQIKQYDNTLNGYTKKTVYGNCRSYCRTRFQRCAGMDAEKPLVPGV